MRFIKLAIISAAVFFLLGTALSLLLPSNVIVSRAIDLHAPADSVHAYISRVDNWQYWIQNADSSEIKTDHRNHVQINTTSITILSANKEKIETEWKVGEGTPMKGDFNFITQENANYFTLHWSFNYHVKWYPWEKFASILSDKALGPFMETSLDKLKKNVEQRPE
jgi:uncharacterized membrane protein